MNIDRALDRRSETGRWAIHRRLATIAVVVGALTAVSMPSADAYPPDPKRPNKSKTCKEALRRVKEAGLGSPLIPAHENRKVFLDALAVAERLCRDR